MTACVNLSGQHFLMSAAARSLPLRDVFALSEVDARLILQELRWPDGVRCPRCGDARPYFYRSRDTWKCRACKHQYTVTSGTLFSSHKMELRTILAAVALVFGSAKGISALQLGRDIGVQYKSAWVLCQKLRDAIASAQRKVVLSGTVEIDGAVFGGHTTYAIRRGEGGKLYRVKRNRFENRRVVVVARQRDGKTITSVGRKESDSIWTLRQRIAPRSTVIGDQAHAWDCLKDAFNLLRIDHSKMFKIENACTNNAESFWSMLRRKHTGVHHHISGRYLHLYAAEMAYLQDHRRLGSLEIWRHTLALAINSGGPSRFAGYWQRRKATTAVIVPFPALVPRALREVA